MFVFKRKQIIVLALILMIVVAGYLQYTYKQGSSSITMDAAELGEAVYVDNEIINEVLEDVNAEASPDTDVSASKEANDFFAQARMNREQSRSKSTETLRVIAEDTAASKEMVETAHEEMINLMEFADTEMRVETLVSKLGFSDCIALFADDGSVDIVVKTPSLSNAQVAQICDVVSRQANIEIEKIHIKKMF